MSTRKYIQLIIISLLIFSSCKKEFLEKEPLSNITPEKYLWEESQLAAYSVAQYGIFPSHGQWDYGTFGWDAHTDNVAGFDFSAQYIPGEWRVSQSGGSWNFGNIYRFNYFLEVVLPRWQSGSLMGNSSRIGHYIGEIYFMRAFEYFNKVRDLGDFPIVTNILPDDKQELIQASKRMPRSEVVRFILQDLDSAINLLLENAPDGKRNRLSKSAALLFKSRVALFEGTWLKYFKDSPFVPNGPNWPGKDKEYNKGYEFQSGSLENEMQWLFQQSMAAASEVANKVPLVENNGILQQSVDDPVNPYLNMFGDVDMSKYNEVLFWRAYSRSLGVANNVPASAANSNNGNGLTRGYVESFLMSNGLPIYDPASGYMGDDFISDVRNNRDGRLWLFLKEPDQINLLYNTNLGTHKTPIEPKPNLTANAAASKYKTGYASRKGINYDGMQYDNGQSSTGSIVFRAVEAYLNYIEADYEADGNLDGNSDRYWRKIRERARVDPDYQKTIAATDMAKEAKNDWGAYSAGQLISPVLYNIRRERRSELLNEAMRDFDLRRWRSKDQLMTNPYHIEGFKIWGPMKNWYTNLSYGNGTANVSSPDRSVYLRPYEITGRELVFNGYSWALAHYLQPIAIQHFQITSENGDLSSSPIYQNPGWSTEPNTGALF